MHRRILGTISVLLLVLLAGCKAKSAGTSEEPIHEDYQIVATYGGELALVDHFEFIQEETAVRLCLRWQSLTQPAENYQRVVRLTDRTNTDYVYYEDRGKLGDVDTREWHSQSIFHLDCLKFETFPVESWQMWVGVYAPQSGEFLPASVESRGMVHVVGEVPVWDDLIEKVQREGGVRSDDARQEFAADNLAATDVPLVSILAYEMRLYLVEGQPPDTYADLIAAGIESGALLAGTALDDYNGLLWAFADQNNNSFDYRTENCEIGGMPRSYVNMLVCPNEYYPWLYAARQPIPGYSGEDLGLLTDYLDIAEAQAFAVENELNILFSPEAGAVVHPVPLGHPVHDVEYYFQHICNPAGTDNNACMLVYLSDTSPDAQRVAQSVVNSSQFDRNAQLYGLLLQSLGAQTGELETHATSTFVPAPTGQTLIGLIESQYGADNACIIGTSGNALVFPVTDTEGTCDAYLIGIGINPDAIQGLDRTDGNNLHAYSGGEGKGWRFVTETTVRSSLESILPGLIAAADQASVSVQYPLSEGEALPPTRAISADNIDQLEWLAAWGRGIYGGFDYSPTSDLLALSTFQGILVYDTRTFQLKYELEVYGQPWFSADGRHLSAWTVDPMQKEPTALVTWDAASGQEISRRDMGVIEPREMFYKVFSHDSKLAAGWEDGSLAFWDLTLSQKSIPAGSGSMWAAYHAPRFSLDDRYFAYTKESPSEVTLLRVSDGRELLTLPHQNDTAYPFFSRDSQWLLVADGFFQTQISVWDIGSQKQLYSLQLDNSSFGLLDLSPDKSTLVVSTNTGEVSVWDITTGKKITQLDNMGVSRAEFSHDGTRLVVLMRHHGRVEFFDTENWRNIDQLPAFTPGVVYSAISPDQSLFAAGHADGSLLVRRTADGSTAWERQVTATSSVRRIEFSPDSSQVLISTKDGLIQLLRASDGKELKSTTLAFDFLSDLAVSPDWRQVAVLSSKSDLLILDMPDLEIRKTIPRPDSAPYGFDVQFSPDGRIFTRITDGGEISVYDARSAEQIYLFRDFGSRASVIAFSPDSTLVASSWHNDPIIYVRRLSDGKLMYALEGHDPGQAEYIQGVRSLAFSPDGRLLASGGEDSSIRLWRVSDGRLQHALEAVHEHLILDLLFSPDGNLLVSRSNDNRTMFWRVSDGKFLRSVYNGFPSGTHWVADGQVLILSSLSGANFVFGVPEAERSQIEQPVQESEPLSAIDTTYTIQTGDNLWKIAQQFGVSLDDLLAANGLTQDSQISVGQVLEIPGGGNTAEKTGENVVVANSQSNTLLVTREFKLFFVPGEMPETYEDIEGYLSAPDVCGPACNAKTYHQLMTLVGMRGGIINDWPQPGISLMLAPEDHRDIENSYERFMLYSTHPDDLVGWVYAAKNPISAYPESVPILSLGDILFFGYEQNAARESGYALDFAVEKSLDINAADSSALYRLFSDSYDRAEAVRDYRKNSGPFQRIEDIQNVPGIGPALFDQIQPYIFAGDSEPNYVDLSPTDLPPIEEPTDVPLAEEIAQPSGGVSWGVVALILLLAGLVGGGVGWFLRGKPAAKESKPITVSFTLQRWHLFAAAGLVLLIILIVLLARSGGGEYTSGDPTAYPTAQPAQQLPAPLARSQTLSTGDGFELQVDGQPVEIALAADDPSQLAGLNVEYWELGESILVRVTDPSGAYAPTVEFFARAALRGADPGIWLREMGTLEGSVRIVEAPMVDTGLLTLVETTATQDFMGNTIGALADDEWFTVLVLMDGEGNIPQQVSVYALPFENGYFLEPVNSSSFWEQLLGVRPARALGAKAGMLEAQKAAMDALADQRQTSYSVPESISRTHILGIRLKLFREYNDGPYREVAVACNNQNVQQVFDGLGSGAWKSSRTSYEQGYVIASSPAIGAPWYTVEYESSAGVIYASSWEGSELTLWYCESVIDDVALTPTPQPLAQSVVGAYSVVSYSRERKSTDSQYNDKATITSREQITQAIDDVTVLIEVSHTGDGGELLSTGSYSYMRNLETGEVSNFSAEDTLNIAETETLASRNANTLTYSFSYTYHAEGWLFVYTGTVYRDAKTYLTIWQELEIKIYDPDGNYWGTDSDRKELDELSLP